MSTSTKPTREKQSTPFQYPRAQRLRNHYEDTTKGKQQETLRRGTEPHRNAITQDTTQEKRHGTLRRGTEPHRNAITQDTTQGKQQETLRRGREKGI